MPIPQGYLTAEEIAVEMRVPIYRVAKVAKDLNIPQVVYPEDNRRRYSPENVKRIKQALEAEG